MSGTLQRSTHDTSARKNKLTNPWSHAEDAYRGGPGNDVNSVNERENEKVLSSTEQNEKSQVV